MASAYILFMRRGAILAVPFDVAALRTTGDPVAVVENVMQSEQGAVFRADGREPAITGGLVRQQRPCLPGCRSLDDADGWIGQPTRFFESSRRVTNPMFSPDGRFMSYGSNETGIELIKDGIHLWTAARFLQILV